jgi:hypothetical protein
VKRFVCLNARSEKRDDALAALKQKLQRGVDQAERNELPDGDAVFDELKEMIDERRRLKAVER